MTVTMLSSREFTRAVGRARDASKEGPVVITDHGQPAHVLLTFAEYQRLVGGEANIVDLLSMDADTIADFDPPRLQDAGFHPADLS